MWPRFSISIADSGDRLRWFESPQCPQRSSLPECLYGSAEWRGEWMKVEATVERESEFNPAERTDLIVSKLASV